MRRSQTVKHHIARPSLALGSDDLGLLREGDETNEDVLRRQLLERDRECERLNNENLALRQELRLRPATEEYQEYQREKKNLEIILQGTQRENERSLNEINRLKERCTLLERELTKLAGENWQSALEIAPAPLPSGRPSVSGFIPHHSRSSTLSSLSSPSPNTTITISSSPITHTGRSSSPRPSSLHRSSHHHAPHPTTSSRSPSPSAQSQTDSQLQQEMEKEQERLAALARVEELRMLILGMEQRFSTREEKVEKLVGQAMKESEKCERLAARLVEA